MSHCDLNLTFDRVIVMEILKLVQAISQKQPGVGS